MIAPDAGNTRQDRVMTQPDADMKEWLDSLFLAQRPLFPSGPRHPKHKKAYFEALAEAYEAHRLVPVLTTTTEGKHDD